MNSFSFKHGNVEVSSEKISLISNTDNSILSIRMEDFDGHNLRSQKILIHQDLNYAFRLGCGGMSIMIIGWLLLISFLPDGSAANILSEIVLYLGGIPLFIGGVLLIALLVNALFGIDLYSKILINSAGKKFNVLTILSKQSSENIVLFTTDSEKQNLNLLIELLSKHPL